MVRLIYTQRGGLAALKLTKLFGIDGFPAARDSGKVLIIIIYCYLVINDQMCFSVGLTNQGAGSLIPGKPLETQTICIRILEC